MVDPALLEELRARARRDGVSALDLLVSAGHVREGTVRALLRLQDGGSRWESRAWVALFLGIGCVLGVVVAVWCVVRARRDPRIVRVELSAPPAANAPEAGPARPVRDAAREAAAAEARALQAGAEERERRAEAARLAAAERARLEREAVAEEQARVLVLRLAGEDRRDVTAALAVLKGLLDDPALALDLRDRVQKEARAALVRRRAALLERFRARPDFAPFEEMKRLKAELDGRRRAALARIYDSATYTYDLARGDHGGRDQPEVDRRVAAVREFWRKRGEHVLRLDSSLRAAVEELREADQAVAEQMGGNALDEIELTMALEATEGPVDLGGFSTDPRERETLVWNRRARAWNAAAYKGEMRPEELKVIELTNDYREMMGRTVLEAHDALGRAARKHSSWMAAHQKLAHEEDDPERRQLGSRVALEGYDGPISGENIAFGPADSHAAFAGWYGSSEHHRNLLDEWYNQIGVGKVRFYWTQDLARGTPQSGE